MARPKKNPAITAEIAMTVRNYFSSIGKKQLEIAAETGLDTSVVSPLLTGKRPFGYKTAKIFAQTYGFSQEFLSDGRGTLVEDEKGVSNVQISEYVPESCFADRDEYNAYLLSKLRSSDIALASAQKKMMGIINEKNYYYCQLKEMSDTISSLRKELAMTAACITPVKRGVPQRLAFRALHGWRKARASEPANDSIVPTQEGQVPVLQLAR